jgi:hypothetical protein
VLLGDLDVDGEARQLVTGKRLASIRGPVAGRSAR